MTLDGDATTSYVPNADRTDGTDVYLSRLILNSPIHQTLLSGAHSSTGSLGPYLMQVHGTPSKTACSTGWPLRASARAHAQRSLVCRACIAPLPGLGGTPDVPEYSTVARVRDDPPFGLGERASFYSTFTPVSTVPLKARNLQVTDVRVSSCGPSRDKCYQMLGIRT